MNIVPSNREELRLLIVDDHTDSADSMAELLTAEGVDVRVAYNGEDAIGIARHFLPDAVILDLTMPSLNGFEVARCLRAEPIMKDVALVALSGRSDEEAKARGAQAGIDAHLTKPVGHVELLRTVAHVLGVRPE